MRLAFLHQSHISYSAQDLGKPTIRGLETSIIQLASALHRRGHHVSVFNTREKAREEEGIAWHPLAAACAWRGDAAIAANEPRLFKGITATRRYLWLHNRVSVEKALRKHRLWPLWWYRPHVVVSSAWHADDIARALALRGVSVIPLGIAAPFRQAYAMTPSLPPPVLAYTADKTRGFYELVKLWYEEIHPHHPKAILRAFVREEEGDAALRAYGIHIMGVKTWSELISALRGQVRAVVFPWDKPETFCLAAAEAISLGIPVITRRVGALPERVQDGKTGLIVDNPVALVAACRRLLSDDAAAAFLHQSCSQAPPPADWAEVAESWEARLTH